MGPDLDGDEVAHAAGRNEEGRFFAEDFGGAAFESIDGGIFEIDVIAHLGFGHGAAHGRRRPRYRVAAKVNYVCSCSRGLQFAFRIGHR
jgi:hypothetical protein